jgi:putative glycosyltransferase
MAVGAVEGNLMRLSVVATMFRSAPYLREFHRRVTAAARRHAGDDYELILVNDGSPDESLALALRLREQDPHLCIIDLSRNFGHHQAMWTGLQHARGDWVLLLDSDLEEAPEWLAELEATRQQTGADVVFGVQRARRGNWLHRFFGALSYKVCNLLSDVVLPENLMTIRLMSRRYLNALLQHVEVTFTIAGLWVRTGFQQVPVPLDKGHKPTSTYGLVRRFRYLVNSITTFSDKPLIGVLYLGATMLLLSLGVAATLIVRELFGTRMQSGWPSLMVTIWFLAGLIIFSQGILGLYLARVFREVKRRPIALIREKYDCRPAAENRLAG